MTFHSIHEICPKCDGWIVNLYNWSDEERCDCNEV